MDHHQDPQRIIDEYMDDDMYLPYRQQQQQQQHYPPHHHSHPQYLSPSSSSSYPYTSTTGTTTTSTSSISWPTLIATILDFVTGPQFGILVAIVVIILFQWKWKLLNWYSYFRQRYYFCFDDEEEEEEEDVDNLVGLYDETPLNVVDLGIEEVPDDEDNDLLVVGVATASAVQQRRRRRRSSSSASSSLGGGRQIILEFSLTLLDTLRTYYQMSIETLRSLSFLVRWIPLLSFSSEYDEDGNPRMMGTRGGITGGGGGGGYQTLTGGRSLLRRAGGHNLNGPPPLWTPDDDDDDEGEEENFSNGHNHQRIGNVGGSEPLYSSSSPRGVVNRHQNPARNGTISTDGDYESNSSSPTSRDRQQQTITKQQGTTMNGTNNNSTTTASAITRNLNGHGHAARRTIASTNFLPNHSQSLLERQGDIEPAFLNDQDYPPGWLVYHPILGVVPKEEADKYDAEQRQHGHSNSHSQGNGRPMFQSSITA